MDRFLSVAHTALMYYGGRQLGIWAPIGVFLGIVIIAAWADFIQPVIEFFKLDLVADKLGLVEEGAAYLTSYRVVISIVALYFALLIIGVILFFILVGLMSFMDTKIAFYGVILVVGIVLLPYFLLVMAGTILDDILHAIAKVFFPKWYQNRDTIQLLANYGGVDNTLTRLEAGKFIDRLPTTGDSSYLIAVNESQELFMILPTSSVGKLSRNLVKGHKIEIRVDENENFELDILSDIVEVSLSNFKTYIDPNNVEDIKQKFDKYSGMDTYLGYVRDFYKNTKITTW